MTGNTNLLAQSDLSLPYDVYIDADGYPPVGDAPRRDLAAADPSGSRRPRHVVTMTMRFDSQRPTIVIEAPFPMRSTSPTTS